MTQAGMPPYSANVRNCAFLVTDRNSQRFGSIARLRSHDWRESGDITLEYADGQTEVVRDANGRIFYAIRSEAGQEYDREMKGPLGLVKAFLDLNVGDMAEFNARYKATFKQDF